MRRGSELHVLAAQAREFGQAKPGAEGNDQQGVVAAAGPGGAIRGGCEDVHLLFREERPWNRGALLLGNGHHLSDGVGVFGMSVGGEAEERVDSGQTCVATSDGVVPVELEMVEKSCDQLGVQVGDVEVGGILSGLGASEGEHQPEGVPVGVDGVNAGAALTVEAVHKERLQGGG